MSGLVGVTQADRDAAASLLGYRNWDDATDYRLTGKQDKQVIETVIAFARHRVAARTQSEAELAELLAALENVAHFIAENHNPLAVLPYDLAPALAAIAKARGEA